jgi:hypothetical protein
MGEKQLIGLIRVTPIDHRLLCEARSEPRGVEDVEIDWDEDKNDRNKCRRDSRYSRLSWRRDLEKVDEKAVW